MRKIKCFTGPNAERRAEIAGQWLKAICGNNRSVEWCIKNKIALTKAQTETSNTAGGFLAPEALADAVIVAREAYGAFRSGSLVAQLKTASQIRPRRANSLTASFVVDGAAIPESQMQFDAIGVNPKKLAIL